MAGQASGTVAFDPEYGPRLTDRMIQIKASAPCAPNDSVYPPEQPTSLTAQEDKQP